jgi:hypothetical protein
LPELCDPGSGVKAGKADLIKAWDFWLGEGLAGLQFLTAEYSSQNGIGRILLVPIGGNFHAILIRGRHTFTAMVEIIFYHFGQIHRFTLS